MKRAKSFKHRLRFSSGNFQMKNAIILMDNSGTPVGVSSGWTYYTGQPDDTALYVYPIHSGRIVVKGAAWIGSEDLPAKLVQQLHEIAARDEWERRHG